MLREGPEDELLDPAELRFRLDSVPAGVWITMIICGAGFAYGALWSPAHHAAAILSLVGAGALGGVAVALLPWRTIVRSRWREATFLAWSLGDVALIIALAALDGGGRSAFAPVLFVPIVFAGLSYPRASVVVVSAVSVLGFLGLAVASGTSGGYALLFSASLGCATLMSTWQARNHERRRELLSVASRTDPLTGALNRRGFERVAAGMLSAVVRLGVPMSLAMLDLDRFKHYNDAHGHAAGDELLCWVVERMRLGMRPTDAVARLGGDEFALLLSGVERPAAQAAVERIRADLAVRVRTSCGLACAPADGSDLDSLYRAADGALYAAKGARLADPDPA